MNEWGVTGVGMAYFAISFLYVIMVYIAARILTGYKFESATLWFAISLFVVGAGLFALASFSETAAMVFGLALTGLFCIGTWRQIYSMTGQSPIAVVLDVFSRRNQ